MAKALIPAPIVAIIVIIIVALNTTPEQKQSLINGLKEACSADEKVRIALSETFANNIKDPQEKQRILQLVQLGQVSQDTIDSIQSLDESYKQKKIKIDKCTLIEILPSQGQ